MTEQRHVSSILIAASGFTYAPTSSTNLGDRAQLTRAVQRLREAFPDARLVAIANSLHDEVGFDDLKVSYSAIRYLTSAALIPVVGFRLPMRVTRVLRVLVLLANARRVRSGRRPVFLPGVGHTALREMEQSSALFMSGAGTFNDLYMSSVGGFWAVLARCMSALGKPVVASGQQVGPLRRFSRRAVAKWALHGIDLLGVRDPKSAASAVAVGIPKQRVVLTGDDAWGLEPATPAVADALLKRHGIPESFIAAQIRFGPSVGWDEADSQSFAVSLGRLSSGLGLPVVFVPCATGLGADDRYAAACVQKFLDAPSLSVEEEVDAPTTKAILGSAALGVGTANHFCVFAASMGTPVVGIHASPYMKHKVTGLAELWPSRIVALPKERGLDPPKLLGVARQLLEIRIGTIAEGSDQPSVTVRPAEPVRFLQRHLGGSERRYSARFVESASVDAYEREFSAGQFMGNVSDLELGAVQSVLEPYKQTPFKRHLDFACGSGRAIGFVNGFAETTTGVDVSANMLNKAKKRFPAVRFVCGDVSSDPLLLDELGRFDLVTMWRFVAPADSGLRLAALSAVSRSMDEGGLLIVNNNANGSSLHSLALLLRSLIKVQALRPSELGQSPLAHRQLCRLLEAAGLSVEQTKAITYLPDQLTRRLPARLWIPVERWLGRLNLAPQYAVNQFVVARRRGRMGRRHYQATAARPKAR